MTLRIRVILAFAFVSAAAPLSLAAKPDSAAAAAHDSASMGTSALPSSPPPSATSLALADTLLVVLHTEANLAAAQKAQLDAMVRAQPAAAKMRDVIAAWQAKYVRWADLRPSIAEIYAHAFTEDDLRSLIAFYRTPLGQRLIAKLPEVLQEASQLGADRAAKHQAELQSMIMSAFMPSLDTTH